MRGPSLVSFRQNGIHDMIMESLHGPDFVIAIAFGSGIVAVYLWLLVMVLLNRLGIVLESRPLRMVRRYCRQRSPNQSIALLHVYGTEPTRWVVGAFVRSPGTPRCRFFVVERESHEITELPGFADYPPVGRC